MVGLLSLASMSCGRAFRLLQPRLALLENWRPLFRSSIFSKGGRRRVQFGGECRLSQRTKFTREHYLTIKQRGDRRRIHVSAAMATAFESSQENIGQMQLGSLMLFLKTALSLYQ